MACHVGGERVLQAQSYADVLQVTVDAPLAPAVLLVGRFGLVGDDG